MSNTEKLADVVETVRRLTETGLTGLPTFEDIRASLAKHGFTAHPPELRAILADPTFERIDEQPPRYRLK